MRTSRILPALAAALLLAVAAPFAHAQAWPSKTVKFIVGFPPGGSTDQVARILAAQLTTALGQQFIVENRPGASGSIGAGAVAQAAPDGATFGVVFDTHGVNPSVLPNLAFSTTKDLANVMLIGTSPMAIVTHPGQPYKNFQTCSPRPRRSRIPSAIGSIGTGSLGHLAMALISNRQGIELAHVPYKGGGPLMTDAIGGQVPLAIGTVFARESAREGGQAPRRWPSPAQASPPCRTCRHSPTRACPGSRRSPGGASSRRPEPQRRS